LVRHICHRGQTSKQGLADLAPVGSGNQQTFAKGVLRKIPGPLAFDRRPNDG
jgi:hypothetical protein